MAVNVTHSVQLKHTPADVWAVAGAFNGLPAISTATAQSVLEDGGRIRVLTNADGTILWERLLTFDDERRELSYMIVDVKGTAKLAYGNGFIGKVQVLSHGVTSEFRYTANFSPAEGWGEDDAKKAIAKFVDDCATGIDRFLQANVLRNARRG
jgi:hypothetical protein